MENGFLMILIFCCDSGKSQTTIPALKLHLPAKTGKRTGRGTLSVT
jgi:hypothetical protein